MINSVKSVAYGYDARQWLQNTILECNLLQRKVFVLVDSNTETHCLPLILSMEVFLNTSYKTICIEAGEKNKTLQTAAYIWEVLTENNADRNALLINLGGGMITDLGGFAASCYKRGIETVHIPTSLLGMVDAAIGGKTGIDFSFYKNQIGSFYLPKMVLILPELLNTLPKRQLKAGFAEVLKYGFIAHPELLESMPEQFLDASINTQLIQKCVEAKENFTLADPHEKGSRKILNFGHSVGHAFESFALENGFDLLHGEAVAFGLLCELWLSKRMLGMHQKFVDVYIGPLHKHFTPFMIEPEKINDLLMRMEHDKKNIKQTLRFVLLKKPGDAVYDVAIDAEVVRKSIEFYIKTNNDYWRSIEL